VFYRDASRTILAENDSPDLGFRFSLNPYRGCEHGCIYCVGPETPVLHADMRARPVGDVRVGDVLVGFDEAVAGGEERRVRRAVVEHVWQSVRPTLRLVTAHAEIVTTAEHRWLAAHGAGWVRTDELAAGRRLSRLPPSQRLLVGLPLSAGAEKVLAIEPGPVRDVVDIQTSTGTFFAAGLATHNCYARPSHEYLGFSAGLDFERRIMVKDDAPALLRKALASPRWDPQVVMLSGNTDCYQPVERRLRLTRQCLEVFAEFRNPVSAITKSALVARDADVFAELARHGAAHVMFSITSLDPELARRMEPRAARPERRLEAMGTLARAGVPVGVMIGPVIPGLNDREIPRILEAAARAGAQSASWVLLRLAKPLDTLFERWLVDHYPERRERVLGRIRDTRDGKMNDSRFGVRQRGRGEYAEQIAALFAVATRKHGLDCRLPPLDAAAFRRPVRAGDQLGLWR
jgi:DNA repair photolyase